MKEPERIRAISLHQPWAQAVALGTKQYETRSWYTDYRGPLVIHAAKFFPMAKMREFLRVRPAFRAALAPIYHELGEAEWLNMKSLKRLLPMGCLVAVCDLVSCVSTELFSMTEQFRETGRVGHTITCNNYSLGNFEPERYVWKLENVQRLPAPIPWAGNQGFFSVPGFTIAEIMAEREDQIKQGYTHAHDDNHFNGEIGIAGREYLTAALDPHYGLGHTPLDWPFESESWRPSTSPSKNFIKGAAMMLAEAEREKRLREWM